MKHPQLQARRILLTLKRNFRRILFFIFALAVPPLAVHTMKERKPSFASMPALPDTSSLLQGWAARFISSVLSETFMACMDDVGQNLPIDGRGAFHAHHLGTDNGKWNEGVRFANLPHLIQENLVIIAVGGNSFIADADHFRSMFSRAEIHVYEAMAAPYRELREKWKYERRVHLHNAGLGKTATSLLVSNDGAEGSNASRMTILDAAAELRTRLSPDRKQIDLLHINCQGCEWEVLLRLVETGALRHVRTVQFLSYNYDATKIGSLMANYCLIVEGLAKTHFKMDGIPFGWERWVLRTEWE